MYVAFLKSRGETIEIAEVRGVSEEGTYLVVKTDRRHYQFTTRSAQVDREDLLRSLVEVRNLKR